MAGLVLFLSGMASLNIWVALTILQSLTSNMVRINGRAFHRATQPGPFWISVFCRTDASLLLFCYLVEAVTKILRHKP